MKNTIMKFLLAIIPMFIKLTLAPALMAAPSNVYAQNTAFQAISQAQIATQLGICVSGDCTLFSCNNVNFQNQDNEGNNVLAQQGGSGKGSGNSAKQGIGQSQSSNQNAQCVSGEDAIVSCNNVNFQNQVNSGNNVLAQFGLADNAKSGKGSGKGSGNSANQGISITNLRPK